MLIPGLNLNSSEEQNPVLSPTLLHCSLDNNIPKAQACQSPSVLSHIYPLFCLNPCVLPLSRAGKSPC